MIGEMLRLSELHRANRIWGGLVLAVAIFSMIPLIAASMSVRVDEPWPVLLSGEPDGVDPGFAALQRRAQDSLEKLIQSEPS